MVNSDKSDCVKLQELMRELVYVAIKAQIEYKAVHVMGKSNILPNLLSRYRSNKHRKQFHVTTDGLGYHEVMIDDSVFTIWHDW